MPDVREAATLTRTGQVRHLEAGVGRPVVLLHGFPLAAEMWRPQLAAAPEGWRFLAPDLRGFGPAATVAAKSLADMAEDIVAWLDALGLERAVIGGLSMGGYVSFALYRMAPERFSALILANTKATADTAQGREGREKMSALVRAHGPSAVADDILPKLLGATSQRSRPSLAALLRGLMEGNTTEGIDGAIQAMQARPDSMDLLGEVSRPSLVIAGAEDVLIPLSESEAMVQRLRRGQLAVIPAAGHMSNLEAPAAFNAVLTGFLSAAR